MEKKNKEAATLQRKKTTINKAKIKKTIKNTLCRPDPIFMPNLSEEKAKLLETALAKHKIQTPEFRKPHWKDLKSIPKEQRPKQPKIQKVEGLVLGISESTEAVKNKKCSAVIIESSVNPISIIQPLILICISNKVPIVCMNGLRKLSCQNFGIPTSCLAIKQGFLQELSGKVEELAKMFKIPHYKIEKDIPQEDNTKNCMEVDENKKQEVNNVPTTFNYLYRTSKSMRVFDPSREAPKAKKAFIGQDFIEFTQKSEEKSNSKAYMSMILKRITNNQSRTKKK